MKTTDSTFTNQNNVAKRLAAWAIVVAGVLMIPFLANAPWTVSDFVFAAVVLFGVATAHVMATRNMRSARQRAVVGAIALLFIFLVIAWAAAGPD